MNLRLLSLIFCFLSYYHDACAYIVAFNQPIPGLSAEDRKSFVRIKDIVSFEGIRGNILMGYGLVVGLDGTGDNVRNIIFTKKELESLLSRMGINANGADLKTKNVAAVIVTASLPPFARSGNLVDVKVSALGDAKSLEGGMLLATPIKGADGEVYALAQGEVMVTGLPAGKGFPGFHPVSRGVKTMGQVANGAIVEKEVGFELDDMNVINISLTNPDLHTAGEIAHVINEKVYLGIARAKDPRTVSLEVPFMYRNNVVGLLSDIGKLEIVPDNDAKIIIDENTGIIVIGEKVKIKPLAISHGELSLSIQQNFGVIDSNKDLVALIESLNHLGVPQRDLIDVLRTIRASGAMQGDLIVK